MERRRFLLNVLAAPIGAGLVSRSLFGEEAPAARAIGAQRIDLEKYRADATKRWGDAIAELERKDKQESHPAGSILFVGSSSIRRWEEIGSDMAPYHPIQRGYGGAKWSDVAIFAERLITPHTFRAAVFFVGNDIVGKADDKTSDEVIGLFSHVVDVVRKHNEKAPVFYVAVSPTPARIAAWPAIKAANSAVREFCGRAQDVHFVGTQSLFLDADGKPRPEFFVEDRLHLNRNGYALWGSAIKSHLDTVLG